MATTTYIGKDQNRGDGNTTYWFDINLGGVETRVGIVESSSDTDVVHTREGLDFWDALIIDACIVTDEMRAE